MAVRKKEIDSPTLDELKHEAIALGLKLCKEVEDGKAREPLKNFEAVRSLIETLK